MTWPLVVLIALVLLCVVLVYALKLLDRRITQDALSAELDRRLNRLEQRSQPSDVPQPAPLSRFTFNRGRAP